MSLAAWTIRSLLRPATCRPAPGRASRRCTAGGPLRRTFLLEALALKADLEVSTADQGSFEAELGTFLRDTAALMRVPGVVPVLRLDRASSRSDRPGHLTAAMTADLVFGTGSSPPSACSTRMTSPPSCAEMAQVHGLADAIEGLTDRVSVLVNNAGIGGGEPDGTDRRVTADGYELRFAVNHLAAFALTQRLLPLLDRGAPARIVNVASLGQAPIDFEDPFIEHGYSGTRV